jgi:hypothetical protein
VLTDICEEPAKVVVVVSVVEVVVVVVVVVVVTVLPQFRTAVKEVSLVMDMSLKLFGLFVSSQ